MVILKWDLTEGPETSLEKIPIGLRLEGVLQVAVFLRSGNLLKFQVALNSFKLLNREYTELVTKGKVDAGAIGRYAYGFGDKIVDGKHIIGHNGGWPGVAANFDMFPELGYTTVILLNMDPQAMSPIVTRLRQLIPTR